MITASDIRSRYVWLEPHLQPLEKNVLDTIAPYCRDNHFAFTSRIKALESLSEKIESGRYANWSEIDDVVAFAVVVPSLADEDHVLDFLERRFRRIHVRRRGSQRKPPDVFRFDSTRFIGRLHPPPATSVLTPTFTTSFEIQVRTAFDHAWIVTTHALAYKTPVIDWRQQRLAAELKATAEKMDLLILAFQEASLKVPESPWPIIDAKKKIQAFFSNLAETGDLPNELLPRDWSRFVDNVYELGHRWKRGSPGDVADSVIRAVHNEISHLGKAGLPRSLSLWQVVLASLSRGGPSEAISDYWPLVTPELESLYPEVKDLQPRFDLSVA